MKEYSKKIRIREATVFAAIVYIIVLLISLSSFSSKDYVDDLWQRLGISKESGNENIKTSFLQGYLYIYGAQSAKNIMAGDRAIVAKDLLHYTKQFVQSDLFKKEYQKARESTRPQEPQRKTARTKDEIRKELIDNLTQSIAETEKNMAGYSAELKKSMQELIDSQKEQIKEYEKPDNEIMQLMADGEKTAVEADWKNYEKLLKEWETSYPENANSFIKKRLLQYLELAKTVDFNAETKERNGIKKFLNPAYEQKSKEWKKIYRAGKSVNDVAVTFIAAWIKEL